MVRLIALTTAPQEHQRQGSVGRPGHRLHKAGQAWLGRLREMQYQKCRLCIEGGPEQTLGGDHRGPGPRTQEDLESPWTTHMERSLTKEVSRERRVPETPKDKCRRCNRISWSAVSNAALTSKRAKSVSWQ